MSQRAVLVIALWLSIMPVQAGKANWWKALEKGDLAEIKVELADGRNPNRAKRSGVLPLTLVSAQGNLEAVKVLMEHGAKPFPKSSQVLPIRAAIEGRHWPVVIQLLDGPGGINVKDRLGRTALIHAILADRIHILGQLLKAGLDPNIADKYGQSPLLYAVEWGRSNHAILLLQYGANVSHTNRNRQGVLDYLALSRDEELLAFLKDPNSWKEKPEVAIFETIVKGESDRVVALLDQDVSIDLIQSFSGDSLVHMAVKHNHPELLKLLLDRNAKPDLMNQQGFTPLMIAVAEGHQQMAKQLVDHGADVNRIGPNSWGVVGYAMVQEGAPMLPLLESWGATAIRSEPRIYAEIKNMDRSIKGEKRVSEPLKMERLDEDILMELIERTPNAWTNLMAANGPFSFALQQVEEWVHIFDKEAFEDIVPPVFTHKEGPVYPEEAIIINQSGTVILRAVLRKDGRISNIEVVKGFGDGSYGFEIAAMASLHKWSFKPGMVNGKPVNVRMTMKIDFIIK